MTMATVVFNSFKRDIMNGAIDLDTDSIYIMQVTNTYTPDIDAHTKRSDVTNEVSGTGYTAGGQALGSPVVAVDNTNDRAYFDSADVVISTASITSRGCVLYKHRGGASSADELIAAYTYGSDITSTAANFTVVVNANGWLLAA